MKSFPKIYKKYTQAGPNYQYYPTTLGFQETITHDNVIKKFTNFKDDGLNLQLLFPFSPDPDCYSTTYQIKLENSAQLTKYIEYIKKEILIYKGYIKYKNIAQIHFSGNGILLLDQTDLYQFLKFISQTIEVSIKDMNLSLDVNARILDKEKLKMLKTLGFKKLGIATLNFDYKLQVSANNYQSYHKVKQLIQQAKKINFDDIWVELFYGLPNESFDNLSKTIDNLIALNCEHICLSHYFHRPYIFNLQKKLNSNMLPTDNENYLRFNMCLEKLLSSGYKHLGMNCFVNKDSDLYLASENESISYNHTGFSLNAINDVLSLGASSISKINGLFYQNLIVIEKYYQNLDSQKIPVYKGCNLTPNHLFRKKIIKFLITRSRFDTDDAHKKHINLVDYIEETCSYLYEMEKEGLITLTKSSIEVTELGKYFLKNICTLFDANMRELILYDISE
jgi:oxygen-independent coproporphyrinogen-3 oxidase